LEKEHGGDVGKQPHYASYKPEPIDVIEGWGLNFHLGNVIKYVGRSPHKGEQIKDLKKAKWYLEREIARLEGNL
jgi:hypothetical protein